MPELSFASIGYINAQKEFVKKNLRAQDVFATNGVSVETHITSADIHLTSTQAAAIAGAIQSALIGQPNGVAPLDASGHIPAQYVNIDLFESSKIVATYANLLALNATQAPLRTTVLVQDAAADATVAAGWALYLRVATEGKATDWLNPSFEQCFGILSGCPIIVCYMLLEVAKTG